MKIGYCFHYEWIINPVLTAKREFDACFIFQAYDKYWPVEMVSDALKKGRLVQGPLRINPRNYEEAYIPHPVSNIFNLIMQNWNPVLKGHPF